MMINLMIENNAFTYAITQETSIHKILLYDYHESGKHKFARYKEKLEEIYFYRRYRKLN